MGPPSSPRGQTFPSPRSSRYSNRRGPPEKGLHWERSFYEQRISETFNRQAVIEQLYRSRLLSSAHAERARRQEMVNYNRQREDNIATPRTRRRKDEAKGDAILGWAKHQTSPRFRDFQLDALLSQQSTPRESTRDSLRSSSGISAHTTSIFTSPSMLSPSYASSLHGGSQTSRVGTAMSQTFSSMGAPSIDEIRQRITLPSLESLMNPRVDPGWIHKPNGILDRESLEHAFESSMAAGAHEHSVPVVPVMPIKSLLPLLSKTFDLKMQQDVPSYMAVRNAEVLLDHDPYAANGGRASAPVIKPVHEVLAGYMAEVYGARAAEDKLKQVFKSCSAAKGHSSSHPRVAIFRRMAGYAADGGEAKWTTAQEMAILQLIVWMGLSQTDSKKAVLSVHLSLKQVDVLLWHLERLKLIPTEGRVFCTMLAAELAAEEGSGQRGDVIDADTLVLRWVVNWAGWDEKEEIRVGMEKMMENERSLRLQGVAQVEKYGW